jgi:quercetin dioxygenase-like cupin family protein
MRIHKPWGYEDLFAVNEHYAFKLLFMKQGCRCSLQYHEVKQETLYVLSGQLKFTHEGQSRILKRGEYFTILPKQVHRMEAVEDSIYLEASTPELDDVVRLEDEYGREGTSEA